MELVTEFPLVPLRDKSEFEEAVKVMKRLAYHRSSLSSGEADYLTVLGDLIAQDEKKLPRLAEELTPPGSPRVSYGVQWISAGRPG
jgi:hypothetical protein